MDSNMQKEKPVNINNTIEITRNYYNKVSLWRSQGFLNGWTGEISKRRVLPSLRILNLKDGHKWLDMGCSNGFNINLGLNPLLHPMSSHLCPSLRFNILREGRTLRLEISPVHPLRKP